MENQARQSLLVDIQTLLHELEDCWIGFNYKEAKNVADKLANFGRDNLFLYQRYYIMPLQLVPLLYFIILNILLLSFEKINKIRLRAGLGFH